MDPVTAVHEAMTHESARRGYRRRERDMLGEAE